MDMPLYLARLDEKAEVFQAWSQGSGGQIIATSILGAGINVQGMTYVLYLDRLYSITNLVQQSGHGGRQMNTSYSIMVVDLQQVGLEKKIQELSSNLTKVIDEATLTGFLRITGCRREIIAMYIDGKVGASYEVINRIQCDGYTTGRGFEFPQLPSRLQVVKEEPSSAKMIAERFQATSRDLETVRCMLGKLGRRCIYYKVIL